VTEEYREVRYYLFRSRYIPHGPTHSHVGCSALGAMVGQRFVSWSSFVTRLAIPSRLMQSHKSHERYQTLALITVPTFEYLVTNKSTPVRKIVRPEKS